MADEATILFKVYEGTKGEKKHSRRYGATDSNAPLIDIYIKRPFANDIDTLYVTLKPKND